MSSARRFGSPVNAMTGGGLQQASYGSISGRIRGGGGESQHVVLSGESAGVRRSEGSTGVGVGVLVR